jgi:hypothetical protein
LVESWFLHCMQLFHACGQALEIFAVHALVRSELTRLVHCSEIRFTKIPVLFGLACCQI